jgi:hypothetical protein
MPLVAVLAACESAAEFDRFDVTVNVLGAGSGDGRVTENETILHIDCQIVGGEPNSLGDYRRDEPCTDTFTDLNGLGTFFLYAVPDPGHEFVGWTGDCQAVQGTACRVEYISHVDVTRTVVAEFRPIGLIIARP